MASLALASYRSFCFGVWWARIHLFIVLLILLGCCVWVNVGIDDWSVVEWQHLIVCFRGRWPIHVRGSWDRTEDTFDVQELAQGQFRLAMLDHVLFGSTKQWWKFYLELIFIFNFKWRIPKRNKADFLYLPFGNSEWPWVGRYSK